MSWLVGVLALWGFLMSLVVHGATYAGVNLSEKLPWVWGLHVLIFPLAIPMILRLRARGLEGRDFWKSFFAPTPKWVKYFVYALGAYTLINFLLFLYLVKGGSPDIRDGQYVLHNHGKIIRELTAEEYATYKAYVLRGFSGHWLYFYFVSAVFYLFPIQKKNSEI